MASCLAGRPFAHNNPTYSEEGELLWGLLTRLRNQLLKTFKYYNLGCAAPSRPNTTKLLQLLKIFGFWGQSGIVENFEEE